MDFCVVVRVMEAYILVGGLYSNRKYNDVYLVCV